MVTGKGNSLLFVIRDMKIRAITCFLTIRKNDDINSIREKIQQACEINKFISERLEAKNWEVWYLCALGHRFKLCVS